MQKTVWIKCVRPSESSTSFPQLFSHLRDTSSRKRKLIKVHSKRCWRKSFERTTRATIMYTAFSDIFSSPSSFHSPSPSPFPSPFRKFRSYWPIYPEVDIILRYKISPTQISTKIQPRPFAARGYHAWVCAFTKYLSTAAALINWLVN